MWRDYSSNGTSQVWTAAVFAALDLSGATALVWTASSLRESGEDRRGPNSVAPDWGGR
jgi:hypothetical protein